MKSIILFASIVAALNCVSCKKENDDGIPTILKGHVHDPTRGINISGYQIVLVKKIGPAPGWDGGTEFETVAEAYTDYHGDYSITFNYKNRDKATTWKSGIMAFLIIMNPHRAQDRFLPGPRIS